MDLSTIRARRIVADRIVALLPEQICAARLTFPEEGEMRRRSDHGQTRLWKPRGKIAPLRPDVRGAQEIRAHAEIDEGDRNSNRAQTRLC